MKEIVEVTEELIEVSKLPVEWFVELEILDWIASNALYYGSDDWEEFLGLHKDPATDDNYTYCVWLNASEHLGAILGKAVYVDHATRIAQDWKAQIVNGEADLGEWSIQKLKAKREEWTEVYEWFENGEHYEFSTDAHGPYADDSEELWMDLSYNEVTFDDLLSPYAKEYINY